MRFKLVEGEQIELKNSEASKSKVDIETDIDLTEEVTVTGSVVFNSEKQILPHVSKWLTEKLFSGITPPGTIITYSKNFSYLFDYLSEHRIFKSHKLDEALFDIQRHSFQEYFTYLRLEKGLASTTINNRDATFQAFFEEYMCVARQDGKALREDNPYEEGLISGAAKAKIVEMCTLDELAALLSCAHHEGEKVLVQFAYDTGLRRTELTRVYKSHVDVAMNSEKYSLILDDETISIPSEYKALYVAGVKGRKREIKERYTLPSIHTLGRLKRYFSSPSYRKASRKFGLEAPAFLNTEGNPYTPGAINKLISRLSKRAVKKGLISRHIHPHMLRHGFAGSVLRSPDLGANAVDKLVVLQHCLGHSALKTTQIYTRLPYDIYGQVVDLDGEVLNRSRLMEQLNFKTKKVKR